MSDPIKCPVCGFSNKAAAVVCDDCGLMIPQFHACSQCGFMNTADSSFCGECGSNLADSEGAGPPPEPVLAPPPPPPPLPALPASPPPQATWRGPTFQLVHEGTGVEIRLPWRDGTLLFGRPGGNPDIDLSGFPDATVVSRKHARLHVLGDALEIEDLGSANGTYVNNVRLAKARNVVEGDRIAFGQGAKVVFLVRFQG